MAPSERKGNRIGRDQTLRSSVLARVLLLVGKADHTYRDHQNRHTELAANRTVLALLERTYAAWVRTGLVSLAAGVGRRKR